MLGHKRKLLGHGVPGVSYAPGASYHTCLVVSESSNAWAVHGATVRRISPSCCRMPTYQQCRKTSSQKLEEFLEEDFMVSFHPGYTSDKTVVQKIVGLFMIRCHGILVCLWYVSMVFCIPECPRGHPYMVGDVSAFKILSITLWVQTFFIWCYTVWGSSGAEHM